MSTVKGMRMKRLMAVLFILSLSACAPATQLGSGAAQPSLQGRVTQETIFRGGPVQDHTHVRGSDLAAGQTYSVRGMLTVDGDVPPKTTLLVQLGRLVVNGNVGDDVKLRVNVPVVSHSAYIGCMDDDFGLGYGGHGGYGGFGGFGGGRHFGGGVGLGYAFGSGYGRGDCTHTVVDGLLYDDDAPAVVIRGGVGNNLDIATYGRVSINGQVVRNPRALAPYRPH